MSCGGLVAKKIFEENASGGPWDRPALHQALEHLREGDVLVVWKLDRLSRSLKDLLVAGELESALAQYEVAVSKNKSTREIDKLQRKANDLLRKARSSLKAKQFTPLKQQYDAITSAKGKKWNESVESKPITRSGKEVPPKKQQSLRKAAEIPPRQMKRAQDKYDRFNTPGFIENNERKGKRFRP
jgi:hypothetical protein